MAQLRMLSSHVKYIKIMFFKGKHTNTPNKVYHNAQKCNNNNNNIYLLQLGCYPVAVIIMRVHRYEISG
jgi:hypothetical protein